MYVIRDVFIAKPGSAGKLAKMMNEAAKHMPEKPRVMLDFVTDFNKIVVEHEVKSLAEFEKGMEDYKKNSSPEMMEIMKGLY